MRCCMPGFERIIEGITLYQRNIPSVIELFEIFERLVVADLCDNHVFEN